MNNCFVWFAVASLWCVWNLLFVFPFRKIAEFKTLPQLESRKTASWSVSAFIFSGALYALFLDKSVSFVSGYLLFWIVGMGLFSTYHILGMDFHFRARKQIKAGIKNQNKNKNYHL